MRDTQTVESGRGVIRLLAAHTASVLADRLVQIAAMGVALAASSTAAAVTAWILFWATIPGIVLAPLAGRAVDRLPRARPMMCTDATRAVLAVGLLFAFQRMTTLPMLYLGVALVASSACFFTPARPALPESCKQAGAVQECLFATAMVMTLASSRRTLLVVLGFPDVKRPPHVPGFRVCAVHPRVKPSVTSTDRPNL